MDKFILHSEYQPTGDQPQAIEALVQGFKEGNQFQTLLGVTGSGKTFTMANVIEQLNKLKSFLVLKRPFSPDNPYNSDEIIWNGRNNMNRICDLDSCNFGNDYRRKCYRHIAEWQLFEIIE